MGRAPQHAPREARQHLRQDAVSPFPAQPLVTGLSAKVSGGGEATGRGTAWRDPAQRFHCQTPHQRPSTNGQCRHRWHYVSLMKDSTAVLARAMDPRHGGRPRPSERSRRACGRVFGLPCKHVASQGN